MNSGYTIGEMTCARKQDNPTNDSLIDWYNSLLSKKITELSLFDITRMFVQKTYVHIAFPLALDMLISDPLIGDYYEGHLLRAVTEYVNQVYQEFGPLFIELDNYLSEINREEGNTMSMIMNFYQQTEKIRKYSKFVRTKLSGCKAIISRSSIIHGYPAHKTIAQAMNVHECTAKNHKDQQRWYNQLIMKRISSVDALDIENMLKYGVFQSFALQNAIHMLTKKPPEGSFKKELLTSVVSFVERKKEEFQPRMDRLRIVAEKKLQQQNEIVDYTDYEQIVREYRAILPS